jgi:hypothetical protein
MKSTSRSIVFEFGRLLSHALRLDKIAPALGHEILNDLVSPTLLSTLKPPWYTLSHVVLWSRLFLPQKILVQDLFFQQLFEVCHRLLLALVFLCWQVPAGDTTKTYFATRHSGFKYICWHRQTQKWLVQITGVRVKQALHASLDVAKRMVARYQPLQPSQPLQPACKREL